MGSAKRLEQERHARFHSIVYAGMIVVEFFVAMVNPVLVEFPRQNAAAIVNVVLVAPSAVDVNPFQRFQRKNPRMA